MDEQDKYKATPEGEYGDEEKLEGFDSAEDDFESMFDDESESEEGAVEELEDTEDDFEGPEVELEGAGEEDDEGSVWDDEGSGEPQGMPGETDMGQPLPSDGEFYDDGADEFGTQVEGIGEEDDDFGLASASVDIVSPNGNFVVQSVGEDEEGHFEIKYLQIEQIACTAKRIRQSHSIETLLSSIRSTGLLQPPVVAPLAIEGHYVLIKGLRRLLACAKAGMKEIPCIVNNRIATTEIPIIEAMYNHHTPYTVPEMIEYIKYLEEERSIRSPSMIEFLLQMDPGDYTKLKDILNDNDDDIVSKLRNGQLDIKSAFKALEKRRKSESREEKELQKVEGVYGDTEQSGAVALEGSGEQGTGEGLTDEELAGLAINAGQLDEADGEDLEAMCKEGDSIEGFQPHKQDPKYRERLDPALRKSVLVRDNNTCQICGIGGQEFVDVLDIHHITEVYLGGDDRMDNLITACTVCHKLVHLYGRGELHIRPMSEMSEAEAKRFKRVVKLGNVIRKQMAMRGMKTEQLKKMDNAETIGRTKPGTGQVAG